MTCLKNALENEDLPAGREIKDGVLFYHFKITEIADRLEGLLLIHRRKIKKELQSMAGI